MSRQFDTSAHKAARQCAIDEHYRHWVRHRRQSIALTDEEINSAFASVARSKVFSTSDFCHNLGITPKQAKAYFGNTLNAPDFPESTIDTFLDCAVFIDVDNRPWTEYLYTIKEASAVYEKLTGRSGRAIREAVRWRSIPFYQFSTHTLRLRRQDIVDFVKHRKDSTNV